jgi:hypothetical protein
MALFNFDPNTVEDVGNTDDVVAPGWYPAVICHSDLEPAKTQAQGRCFVIGYRISDEAPEFARRQIRTWLYIEHSTSKAAAIANSSLKRILAAAGIPSLTNTEQLLGSEVMIRVGVQPAKDGYPARNKITDWRRMDALSQPAQPTPAAARVAAAAAKKGWR